MASAQAAGDDDTPPLIVREDKPFMIPFPRRATTEQLMKWREATLTFNCHRRFRYTLDIKTEEENRRKISEHARPDDSSEGLPRAPSGGNRTSRFCPKRSCLLSPYFHMNNPPRRKERSFLVFLWESSQDWTVIALLVAAGGHLALVMATKIIEETWIDKAGILFATIVDIFIRAVSDYIQWRQLQNLNEEKKEVQLEVIRDGRSVRIPIFDIAHTDVIELKIGDEIPVDGVLSEGVSLTIMTLEGDYVNKNPGSQLMSGCKVVDGSGKMTEIVVRERTERELRMVSISEDIGEETPLQVRMNGVATVIGEVGCFFSFSVLVALLAWYLSGRTRGADVPIPYDLRKTSISALLVAASKFLTIAVAMVVVSVPKGLPLAVTLTLTFSMRELITHMALVRRLAACEIMGSVSTICLTSNQTVVRAYVGGKDIPPNGGASFLSDRVSTILFQGIAQITADIDSISERTDLTEKAILSWGFKLGMDCNDVRSRSKVLRKFNWNPKRKREGVALQAGQSEFFVHWKGDAESILSSCTTWLDENGQTQVMGPDMRNRLMTIINDMQALGLHCVAFAHGSIENVLPVDELTLTTIMGIEDPCRQDIKDAVQLFNNAGVKVCMVTCEDIETAKEIVIQCGILVKEEIGDNVVCEGKVFRGLAPDIISEAAENLLVMGASSPSDKLLLVKALRKKVHVVAVIGDGMTDTSALHEADISVAMGIRGTQLGKESSDIIVLDDNFASVEKVFRHGFSVYENIQKFIQFQLTVISAAVLINFVAAVSSGNVPLNPVQLLWVGLITDTLGALALATESPPDHPKTRPIKQRVRLITNVIWRNVIIQVLYQSVILLFFYFRGVSTRLLKHNAHEQPDKVKNTLIFNSFVLCLIFIEFNARKPEEKKIFSGVTRNHLFMVIVVLTVLFQVFFIEVLGIFSGTVRLGWILWLVSLAIGLGSLLLCFVGKLIPVQHNSGENGKMGHDS